LKNLLLLIPLILFANVNVSVNKEKLYIGEELVVSISANGKDIKFPSIKSIDGERIVGTSSSESINIINGNMSQTITKSFILYPKKDLTIPSFKVYVNGKLYKTKPIHITVTAPKQTKGDFELDINVSKHNLYLGESAIFTIKFIQKNKAASIQIQKPTIPGFLLKQINSNETDKGDEKILTYTFLITPQKVGNYNVGPLVAHIGKVVQSNSNDFFGFQMAQIKYYNVYSNNLHINVKPIPQNSIYGDFNISLNAKHILNANEVNKATLTIKGCGDFYSLNNMNLTIPNATIYPNKMQKKLYIKNNRLCGEAIQTFNIVASNDYTIPSISLKIFDGNSTKIIKTKKIDVKILNATKPIHKPSEKKITPVTSKPKQHSHSINSRFIILIALTSLIIGIIIGILIYVIYIKLKDEEIKAIKNANNPKELLNLIKKYEYNNQIKAIMEQLEENIYKNKNNQINKKEIIKIIKSLRK